MITYYDSKHNDTIKDKFEDIYNLSVDIYSLFTDIYLLRRILDKNYITNCIIYSGSQHSVNYMYFLIKYCNFQLVKIHQTIEKDLTKIIDLIKNSKYVFNIYKLIYMNDKKYLQCIPLYIPFPNEHRGGTIEPYKIL